MEIKIEHAEGLADCRKLLMMAKAGKYNGYLLEGMACPGGCVAGAGTVQPIAKSTASVKKHVSVSTNKHALQSDYRELLAALNEDDVKRKPEDEDAAGDAGNQY